MEEPCGRTATPGRPPERQPQGRKRPRAGTASPCATPGAGPVRGPAVMRTGRIPHPARPGKANRAGYPDPMPDDFDLDRFRGYLHLLARLSLRDRATGPLDPSDVVQQTMLEAHRNRGRLPGRRPTPAGPPGCGRSWPTPSPTPSAARHRAKRDAARERSLEASLAESSVRLGNWLAAERRVAERRRPTPTSRRCGWRRPWPSCRTPSGRRWCCNTGTGGRWPQIGEQLGRSPAAVAGLLKRGLKRLREAAGRQGRAQRESCDLTAQSGELATPATCGQRPACAGPSATSATEPYSRRPPCLTLRRPRATGR